MYLSSLRAYVQTMAKKPLVDTKTVKYEGKEYDEPDVEKFSHLKKKGKHKRGKKDTQDR